MVALLPWHEDDWARVSTVPRGLHHGLVLAGPSGIGKREFAVKLAQWLLCGSLEEKPCGNCQDCRLFEAGTHPDFHVILSEAEVEQGRLDLLRDYAARYPESRPDSQRKNPSRVITVEKIRLLIDRFVQSSHTAQGRVALLLPADRMNVNAANALLKLLEEPPADGHFLLVTDQPDALLPTIRSRCLVETLAVADSQAAGDWLKRRAGGPRQHADAALAAGIGPLDVLAQETSGLLAKRAAELDAIQQLCSGRLDPVVLAGKMSGHDAVDLLRWLQQLVGQLIRWHSASGPPPWGELDDVPREGYSPRGLFALYDKIGRYRRIARDQLNLQLALEEVFVSLQRAGVTSGNRARRND